MAEGTCELERFGIEVAADTCDCSPDDCRKCWMDVALDGPVSFDPTFVILIIELIIPVIIEILQNCPDPEPDEIVGRIKEMGRLQRLLARRKVRRMLQAEGMDRKEAKAVAEATLDQARTFAESGAAKGVILRANALADQL